MTSVIKTDDYSVKQIKTGCLAHYAYVIESKGEMAVIDPLRDIEAYKQIAEESKSQLKWVILTHYHADYVSGYFDLATQTKATIVYGPDSNPSFDCKVAKHDELIPIGSINLRVLHTPGHTFESSSFVLEDPDKKQVCVFTGDTLFLGDVGRPDLAQKGEVTEKDLAKMMFKSLKLLKALPDDCTVLPGHGAGSSCGKNISAGDHCTIGIQKTKNQSFKEESEEEFIKITTANIPPAPAYFSHDIQLNRAGKVSTYFNKDHFDRRSSRALRQTNISRQGQEYDPRPPRLCDRFSQERRFHRWSYPRRYLGATRDVVCHLDCIRG